MEFGPADSPLPAAGKTGTSHDGWFAGYTSNLLCIVWVGYDDYSDIRLSGAQTAAPIWAEFMKKAVTLPHYSDMKPFTQPKAWWMCSSTRSPTGWPRHPARTTTPSPSSPAPNRTIPATRSGGRPRVLLPYIRWKFRETPASADHQWEPAGGLRCPIRGRGGEEEEPPGQNCGRIQGRWQLP